LNTSRSSTLFIAVPPMLPSRNTTTFSPRPSSACHGYRGPFKSFQTFQPSNLRLIRSQPSNLRLISLRLTLADNRCASFKGKRRFNVQEPALSLSKGSKVQGRIRRGTSKFPEFRNLGNSELLEISFRGQEGSIKTPLLFSWMADYFFSLVGGSLLMGSIFSFFISFISLPMGVPTLAIPSFSDVWLSNCPVAFKPLAS
jgi:hypothetical protein